MEIHFKNDLEMQESKYLLSFLAKSVGYAKLKNTLDMLYDSYVISMCFLYDFQLGCWCYCRCSFQLCAWYCCWLCF
jgi:hypothetical protein